MNRVLVLITKTDNGFSAYAPDVPGCVAAADTLEETEQLMHKALVLHLEDMRSRGDVLPNPTHVAAEFVLVSVQEEPSSAA